MKRAILLILALVNILGCSPAINVSHDYDHQIDFSRFATFAWLKRSHTPPSTASEAELHNDLMDERIRSAVEKELLLKGLKKDENSPDLLVTYYTGVKDQIRVVDWGYQYPHRYSSWTGRNIDVFQYQEGTLIVDLIEASSKKLIWRATATSIVDKNKNPEQSKETINRAASKMFKPYPYRPGAKTS